MRGVDVTPCLSRPRTLGTEETGSGRSLRFCRDARDYKPLGYELDARPMHRSCTRHMRRSWEGSSKGRKTTAPFSRNCRRGRPRSIPFQASASRRLGPARLDQVEAHTDVREIGIAHLDASTICWCSLSTADLRSAESRRVRPSAIPIHSSISLMRCSSSASPMASTSSSTSRPPRSPWAHEEMTQAAWRPLHRRPALQTAGRLRQPWKAGRGRPLCPVRTAKRPPGFCWSRKWSSGRRRTAVVT